VIVGRLLNWMRLAIPERSSPRGAKTSDLHFRRGPLPAVLSPLTAAIMVLTVFGTAVVLAIRHGAADAGNLRRRVPNFVGASSVSSAKDWNDSLGDGFPDSARIGTARDRDNFVRWFTFLAETLYYAPRTREEVQDCAALVRFAYRNSLVPHSSVWRRESGLPFDPGFGDIAEYNYPHWVLGRGLFRTRPGPAAPGDLAHGVYAEFADTATLLRYNTCLISRDVRSAQAGDLLFYHQPVQTEAFHTMLFVGKSYYQPRGSDWIVYHTGDINGERGEIREVQVQTLLNHPDLHWRPLIANPNFLGVYRLEILR
jgi:uncharacterized protein YfaT (DUF1175 family)